MVYFLLSDGVKRLHVLLCQWNTADSDSSDDSSRYSAVFTDRYHTEHLFTDVTTTSSCQSSSCHITNDLLSAMSAHCYLTTAASIQPITRQQYSNCRELWPTFFHEDKRFVNNAVYSALLRPGGRDVGRGGNSYHDWIFCVFWMPSFSSKSLKCTRKLFWRHWSEGFNLFSACSKPTTKQILIHVIEHELLQ